MLNKSKNAGLSVLLIALLFSTGCQVNNINLTPLMDASKKSSDLFEKSLDEEVALGHEVSGVLLKDLNLYNVAEVQRYVSSVGLWLALHSDRKEVPWKFAVIRDDSFNAYATPGGYIYITTGTLGQLESEAELAGVLAHEIAHVVEKHHLQAIQKEARVGIAADLAKFLRDSQRDTKQHNELFAGMSPEAKLLQSVQDIYSDGLAREDELDADRLGMLITARAGYDPMAYISVLQKIDSRTEDSYFWQRFSQRHPSATDRLEALEEIAATLSPLRGKVLNQRYADMVR